MYKRSELMKILAVSIVLLFLVSGFSIMVYGSGPEKSISSGDKSGNISNTNITLFTQINYSASPSIIYQAPITIYNTQSSATPSPFQLMIQLNESTYKPYISYTTSTANFEFSYSNNTIIPAWIESNNSGVLTIWLKLYSIPALSSITIYIDFASLSTNLLSSSGIMGIGEAPQLSPTYGEYDDGAIVFPLYSNFYDTLAGYSAYSYIGSFTPVPSPSPYNDVELLNDAGDTGAYILSPNSISPGNYILQTYWSYNGTADGFSASLWGDPETIYAGGGGDTPGMYNGLTYHYEFYSAGNWAPPGGDSNVASVYSLTGNNAGTLITSAPAEGWGTYYVYSQIAFYNITSNSGTVAIYSNATGSTSTPNNITPAELYNSTYQSTANFSSIPLSASPILFGAGSGFYKSYVYIYWALMRAYPPNGVMPSVSFGSAVPTYTVTFIEKGLPSGTPWSVTLNGATEQSNTSKISLAEINGTYSFFISNPNPINNQIYRAMPSSGTVTVNGNNVVIQVNFFVLGMVTSSFTNLTSIVSQEGNYLEYPEYIASHGNIVLISGTNSGSNATVLLVFNKSSNQYNTIQVIHNTYPQPIIWAGSGFLIPYTNATGYPFYEIYNSSGIFPVSLPSVLKGKLLDPLIYYDNKVFMWNGTELFAFNYTNYSTYREYNLSLPSGSYIYSACAANSELFLAGQIYYTNTSIPLNGLFNITNGTFTRLSPSSPINNNSNIYYFSYSVTYLDGNFYFGGGNYYFNSSSNGRWESLSGTLYLYNISSGKITNISSILNFTGPVGNLFVIKNNIGITIYRYSYYSDAIQYLTNRFFIYNSTMNKTTDYTYLTGTQFLVYNVSVSDNYAYFIGLNYSNSLGEFLYMNETSMNTTIKPIGTYYSNFWTGNSYYGDGGFITVGGNGLTFYKNGQFESPSQGLPGFLLGSAWNGNYFLVVGSTYLYNQHKYNGGPILGIYYPQNNTLISLDNLVPSSLLKNATFNQVVWDGSSFIILGEQWSNLGEPWSNESGWWSNTILYSYSPSTGVLQNISNLLPVGFNTTHMTGMVNTPYGTFILLYSYYGARLGLFENNKIMNLTFLIPQGFTFNSWWPYGSPMSYGNGMLFIAGNYYNGSIMAMVYNVETNQSYNFGYLFSGLSATIYNVAYSDGLFILYGVANENQEFLYALNPITDQIYDLDGYIPTNFASKSYYGLNTIAAQGNTIYITGGSWGDIYYGLLNLTVSYNVSFTEENLPIGSIWYINISGQNSYSYEVKVNATPSYTFSTYLPNGNYTYKIATVNKIYAPSPCSGTFAVNGANVNIGITFNMVTYQVTFTENGLPSGTKWYVNLSNGQSFSGTGTTITFNEPNGTYSYTIATVNKIYAPSQSSGTLQ